MLRFVGRESSWRNCTVILSALGMNRSFGIASLSEDSAGYMTNFSDRKKETNCQFDIEVVNLILKKPVIRHTVVK